jgi:hypothetical protein
VDLCIWLEILSLLLISWLVLVGFLVFIDPSNFGDALDCWLKSVKTLTFFKKVFLACKLVFEFLGWLRSVERSIVYLG